MKKLKVMTVVGTRPEIIRLACVMKKLDASPAIEHVLVHTGQNYDYELNEVFFKDLGLRKPDYFLNAAGGYDYASVEAYNFLALCGDPDRIIVVRLGDSNVGHINGLAFTEEVIGGVHVGSVVGAHG